MKTTTFDYGHVPGRGTRLSPTVLDYEDASTWLRRFSKLDLQARKSEVARWRSLARRRQWMNAVMRSRFTVEVIA